MSSGGRPITEADFDKEVSRTLGSGQLGAQHPAGVRPTAPTGTPAALGTRAALPLGASS
jgi:hypothetical protein